MLKKIKQYKRMIGEALELIRNNNNLLQVLLELIRNNNNLLQVQNAAHEKEEHTILGLEERFKRLEMKIEMQNEISSVNTATFAKYRNVHMGKDVVVLGSGPTLIKYKQLKSAIHIGVNSVYKYKKAGLDFYFAQDFKDLSRSWIQNIEDVRCVKFLGFNTDKLYRDIYDASESLCLSMNASRYYRETESSNDFYVNICEHPLIEFGTIVFPAIQFALFTNPRRIYLAGVDTSFGGYFTSEIQIMELDHSRFSLSLNLVGYRRLKEFAQRWYPETEIISINPVNLKGLFRDMYTDDYGALVDCMDDTSDRNFSDEAIRDFVDRHIEQVLIDRLHTESSCKECGKRDFSISQGLSDDNPDKIEVKCNACSVTFSYS